MKEGVEEDRRKIRRRIRGGRGGRQIRGYEYRRKETPSLITSG